jgi:hypothetical protein
MRQLAMMAPLLALIGCANRAPTKIDLAIQPFDVAPGTEVQNCIYLKVPSDSDIDIGHVLLDFAPGTHHMHVYYGDEQHADGMESCFQAVDFDKWHLLVGEQKPQLEWTLPPGIAFHLKAHQQLLIQVHFVNASTLQTAGNQAHGTIHFDARPSSEVHGYMGSIFGQQRGIDILPNSSFSVDGICRLPHALSMGALAGHYHFKGKDFTAARMSAGGAVDSTPFYRTDNFAEPRFDIYGEDNPLRFADGERILWHCDYQNDTNMEVLFGPRELTQEHCNMFAFYYPVADKQEFTPCVSYGRCAQPCAADQTCNDDGECVQK